MNTENETQPLARLPLWKGCLEEMMRDGATFESAWAADFFEERLKEKLGTPQFSFAMLALRKELLDESGYYLRSSESGKVWDIPGHDWHILTQGPAWASRARESLRKQIHIVNSTLANPAAKLTEETRKKAEHQLYVASLRLMFFNRPKAIADVVTKHSPKLLGLETP